MKPLTAEEIAELRRLDKEGTRDWYDIGLNGVKPVNDRYHIRNNPADHELAIASRNALPRLLDEVERSRALLKRIERKGVATMADGYPDFVRDGCPECGSGGSAHRARCELAMLGGLEEYT